MELRDIFIGYLFVTGVALVLGLTVLALTARSLRRLDIPEDAGFFETLERVPLALVLGLDLLDLGLDIFAAPVSYVILRHFRLHRLRQVTVVEAIIPGTQLLPALTVAWFYARLAGHGTADPRLPSGEPPRLTDRAEE